jgi:hypothetical protein
MTFKEAAGVMKEMLEAQNLPDLVKETRKAIQCIFEC